MFIIYYRMEELVTSTLWEFFYTGRMGERICLEDWLLKLGNQLDPQGSNISGQNKERISGLEHLPTNKNEAFFSCTVCSTMLPPCKKKECQRHSRVLQAVKVMQPLNTLPCGPF